LNPIFFVEVSPPGVEETDFGIVHQVALPFWRSFLQTRAKRLYYSQFASLNLRSLNLDAPKLVDALESFVRANPGPHLIHGIGCWAYVGVALEERLRQSDIKIIAIASCYGSAAHHADGKLRCLNDSQPALAIWVSMVGYGCFADWVSMGPHGVHLGEAIKCFASLLMTSAPLSVAMLVMLRYAALLRSMEVSVMGGLAVAAVTSFALSLFHELDATAMILVWNLGSAVLIAALASVFGRSMLASVASRLMPNRALPPLLP
jgi:hypothetical protein